jgi:hypothetical protein
MVAATKRQASPAQIRQRREAAEARHSNDSYFRTIARRSEPITAEQFALIRPLIAEALLVQAVGK